MGKITRRLPEELIEEILTWLPVKSLLRFRCVCKSWYRLFKSPYFINMHISKSRDNILVIHKMDDMRQTSASFYSYELLDIISSRRVEIPQDYFFYDTSRSCNGLFCLVNPEIVLLCNPSMREFDALPSRPFSCLEGWDCVPLSVGLGFDSNTNDYKVVVHDRRYPAGRDFYPPEVVISESVIGCEIYDLSIGGWREINHVFDKTNVYHSGPLLNGRLHWIERSRDNHRILSLDMSTELFQYMEFPDIKEEEQKWLSFVVFDGCLAFFAYTSPFSTSEHKFVDMWVMQQYGVAESWTKQFTIGPMTQSPDPVLFWKNETILLENREKK